MKLFSPKNTINLGKRGELIALKYLSKQNYTILERNFKNNFGRQLGEIDIIAKKDEYIVFVEVKTRLSLKKDTLLPEENITNKKIQKLNKIISFYLKKFDKWDTPHRIDAISIIIDKETNNFKLNHIQNIFI